MIFLYLWIFTKEQCLIEHNSKNKNNKTPEKPKPTMYRPISSAQSRILSSFAAVDTFGSSIASRGRMLLPYYYDCSASAAENNNKITNSVMESASSSSSSSSSIFICPGNNPKVTSAVKELLVPLCPSKAACNVYGSVHGGALWSFSDYISTLHLQLALNATTTSHHEQNKENKENKESHEEEEEEAEAELFENIRTINASCRYHNGVAQDSKMVCRSTIISLNESAKTVQFYVDLIPEKFAPLVFDKESDEWKVRRRGTDEAEEVAVIPDKTFTRAVFTKSW